MLAYRSEEETQKDETQAKLRYLWMQLDEAIQLQCTLDWLGYVSLKEYIEEHYEDMHNDLCDSSFHPSLSNFAMRAMVQSKLDTYLDSEVVSYLWYKQNINHLEEWLENYHDQLYAYFDLDHDDNIWVNGDAGTLLHLNEFNIEFDKRMKLPNSKDILTSYLQERGYTSKEELTLENKIELYHYCCPYTF